MSDTSINLALHLGQQAYLKRITTEGTGHGMLAILAAAGRLNRDPDTEFSDEEKERLRRAMELAEEECEI